MSASNVDLSKINMAAKKLKDWFDMELAIMLADKIVLHSKTFDKKGFVKAISAKIKTLELKDRIEVFADEIHKQFKDNYPKAVKVLSKTVGPENEEETGMFKEFYWLMPFAKYVEKYGLDDYDISIKAIAEITKRNTSEYAIRPYLEMYPKRTLSQMKKWSKDKNFHIRRLSSEGVRPRLPWASKLDSFIKDPKPLIPILNNLKDDKSKYVQNSVANCINDLIKDNPAIAKSLIEKWNVKSISKERQWIIKHALRKLIKTKDKWALGVIKG